MKGIAILVFVLAVGVGDRAIAGGHGAGHGGHGGGHGHGRHGGGNGGGHHDDGRGHSQMFFFLSAAFMGSYWAIPRLYGSPEPGDFLLYCPDAAGYYPEVISCPSAWWRISPTEPETRLDR
jgi:hypothetical protein